MHPEKVWQPLSPAADTPKCNRHNPPSSQFFSRGAQRQNSRLSYNTNALPAAFPGAEKIQTQPPTNHRLRLYNPYVISRCLHRTFLTNGESDTPSPRKIRNGTSSPSRFQPFTHLIMMREIRSRTFQHRAQSPRARQTAPSRG